jgi:hypothetical protein
LWGLDVLELSISETSNLQYAEIPFDSTPGTAHQITLKPTANEADKAGTQLYAIRLRIIEDPQLAP